MGHEKILIFSVFNFADNNVIKPKSISDRIFNRLPTSNSRNDSNQSRAPFQAVKKRLGQQVGHVLQEVSSIMNLVSWYNFLFTRSDYKN